MNRLESHLRDLRDRGDRGLIPFVSAGDPDLATTARILTALSDAGAAAIEVGIPFSDPIADGPTIQASSQRALDGGTTLSGVLDMLAGLKTRIACPLVAFSYVNPIHRMGYERFAYRAVDAGIDAVLLTDAVPGAAPALEAALVAAGLARIVLVAPTTPSRRVAELASHAEGFVYVIARRGVTGRGSEQSEAPRIVEHLRSHTDVPVYVGFGVRERTDVERISAYADGVIVGSALVDRLHHTPIDQRAMAAGQMVRGLLGHA
jgi:tryptophan synthase alpha chain